MCTRYGLAIGYYCSPIVLLLMAAFYPIAFPIAMLLDRILGKDHGTFFRRAGELFLLPCLEYWVYDVTFRVAGTSEDACNSSGE